MEEKGCISKGNDLKMNLKSKYVLHDAIQEGATVEEIREILTLSENPIAMLTLCTKDGLMPMHRSLMNAKSDIVHLFLEIEEQLAQVAYKDIPAIHLALSIAGFESFRDRCSECLMLLLKSGAYINAIDRLGRNVLHIAASHNMCELSKKLIRLGVNVLEEDFGGLLPIQVGIEKDQVEVVSVLLQIIPIDTIEKLLPEPLLVFALRKGSWSCFFYLLSLGFRSNIQEYKTKEKLSLTEIAEQEGWRKEYEIIEKYAMMIQDKKLVETTAAIEEAKQHGRDSEANLLVVTDKDCLLHAPLTTESRDLKYRQQRIQPENEERLQVLTGDAPLGILLSDDYLEKCLWLNTSPPANISDILRVHEYSMINHLKEVVEKISLNPQDKTLTRFDRDTIIRVINIIFIIFSIVPITITTFFSQILSINKHIIK